MLSSTENIIEYLKKDFHPNYHLILAEKWKIVSGDKESTPEIMIEYCKDLLPIGMMQFLSADDNFSINRHTQ